MPRLHLVALAALLTLLAPAARAEPAAAAAVRALGSDPSLKVRAQAAIVLGQRGGEPGAVAALRAAATQDPAAAVRIAAVAALGKLGAREARPTLRMAQEADADAAVRAAAARALGALGPLVLAVDEPTGTASARPALREALGRGLRDRGFTVGERGDVTLRPAVTVTTREEGGKTVIAVRATVAAVDGDGRTELTEGAARASVAGALPGAKLPAVTAKVVEAAAKGVCDDLAARLATR